MGKKNNLSSGEIGQSSIWFCLEKWFLAVQDQEPSKKKKKIERITETHLFSQDTYQKFKIIHLILF